MDKSILNDLITYDPNYALNSKAERVYLKCIYAGKTKLAHKIWEKYKGRTFLKSDLAISFVMALAATKKMDNEKDINL